MASYNKVLLIGNLTRDPELRTTPKGTAVTDLGLAINSSFKGQDGAVREDVCFVSVEAWGRQAETCKEFLVKGSSVLVEGSLRFDSWETKEGEKRSRLTVRAERVQFLDKREGGERRERSGSSEGARGASRPAQESRREAAPLPRGAPAPPPSDDDIPF